MASSRLASPARPGAAPLGRGDDAPIGALVAAFDEVSPEALVRDVGAQFLAEPRLDAVALTQDGEPKGLLTRSRLLATLARSFGQDLFARKPVSRIADLEPLVLPGATRLADAVSAALRRRRDAVYDDVIVTGGAGGFAGLLPVRALVVEQALALARGAYEREVALARARDLELLEAERRRFVAHAAHELRSPVQAIVLLAERLRGACERRSWEELEQRVPVLLRTAATLRTTVGEMLDLSTVEAGRAVVRLARVDLAALVNEVAATAAVLVGDRPVRVHAAVPAGGGPVAVTDEQKLRQILLNLASNAAKFTAQGEIRIAAAAEPHGGARLWVADTGPGIRREDLARLFAPFSQLGDPASRAGTGLGLAISRSFASLLGAELAVESRPGEGSTFTLLLPATPR